MGQRCSWLLMANSRCNRGRRWKLGQSKLSYPRLKSGRRAVAAAESGGKEKLKLAACALRPCFLQQSFASSEPPSLTVGSPQVTLHPEHLLHLHRLSAGSNELRTGEVSPASGSPLTRARSFLTPFLAPMQLSQKQYRLLLLSSIPPNPYCELMDSPRSLQAACTQDDLAFLP